MTTKVTVFANHGWPVQVTPVWLDTGKKLQTVHGAPNEQRDFYIFAGQDLLIHEVQPAGLKD